MSHRLATLSGGGAGGVSHLSRLPPLQAIGKATIVDQEEPPDILSDTEFEQLYDEYHNDPNEEEIYIYHQDHAEQVCTSLTRSFQTTCVNKVCKRVSSPSASAFVHCRAGVRVGSHYQKLRTLLETRARLQLVRDYTQRINGAAIFVKDLEALCRDEYKTWYDVCHNSLTSPPTSRLQYLDSIAEGLRVHMNHWRSVKHMVYNNRWLQPMLPQLSLQMEAVRLQLLQLRNLGLWWMDRLIRVGLQVLAHCDLDHMTHDALWSLTRGLEHFNHIVNIVSHEPPYEDSDWSLACERPLTSTPLNEATTINSYLHVVDMLRPIAFARVLNAVANERAKYAAVMTHRFFTADPAFLSISRHQVTANSDLPWGLLCDNTPDGAANTTHTSDYHSASGGSVVSLTNSLLQLSATLTAPDLSNLQSPVLDFARREREFASKFLHIVVQSTSLLKRPAPHMGLRTSSRRRTPRSSKRRTHEHSNELEAIPSDSAADPKRKSVSWSDATDTNLQQQFVQRYIDFLWTHLGTHLWDFLHESMWGGSLVTDKQLGSLDSVTHTTALLLSRSMLQVCAKDMFPEGAMQSVTTTARKLEVGAAWGVWDHDFGSALASQTVDKCEASLLSDGQSCTSTARLLRNSYQSLHAMLQDCYTPKQQHETPQNSARQQKSLLRMPLSSRHISFIVPTLYRLESTCLLSTRWCQLNTATFLSSWALSSLLLITHSDLKILGDETKQACYECEQLINQLNQLPTANVDHTIVKRIHQITHRINNTNTQLQTLFGSTIKEYSVKCTQQAMEFFKDEFPLGKSWRKKSYHTEPSEVQQYVGEAVEVLLEPVIDGVNKLPPTSQLSAVSMCVVSMCEAWCSVILQNKVRFSLHGALQLEVDFSYIQNWLHTALHNTDVKQSVLALDIFKKLYAICDLLKRQPSGRNQSQPARGRNGGNMDVGTRYTSSSCMDCKSSVVSGSMISDYIAPSTYDDDDESFNRHGSAGTSRPSRATNGHSSNSPAHMQHRDNNSAKYKVEQAERWLALRVHGGARSWPRFPSCFNNTE